MCIATEKKIGRPTDNPKNTMFRVRLDDTHMKKLNESADLLDTSRSEVIRKGIDKVYDDLKK